MKNHRGTAPYGRIHDECVDPFPTAASTVTGKSPDLYRI